jgi:hypothetical protein
VLVVVLMPLASLSESVKRVEVRTAEPIFELRFSSTFHSLTSHKQLLRSL